MLARHDPLGRVDHVHLLLPGGHDPLVPARLAEQGGHLPQLVNAAELGQGYREGHSGHVEEERLKLVAGIQVFPGRRGRLRFRRQRGFGQCQGDGLGDHRDHLGRHQGHLDWLGLCLDLELEGLDMHLLMAQDIHLILHLAHLGEQFAQLRQSVVGFEIGRRNHLGQGGRLRLQLQHRGRRLVVRPFPQQGVIEQQGVEIVIHGPNLGGLSHGFTSWVR
ncbi:hypothetical protein D3C79_740710 [compost metagenome]